MPKLRHLSCLVLLATPACIEELPDEEQIVEPRILAVTARGDADAMGRRKAEFLPGDPVDVDLMLVDVDGPMAADAVEALWLACPLAPRAPVFDCLFDAVPVRLEDVPACSGDDTARGEAIIDFDGLCVLSDELRPSFVVPDFPQVREGFTIELSLVLALGDDPSLTRCADAMLGGDFDTPEGCLYAGTEVPLGPLHLLVPPEADLDIPVQDADTHPRLDGVAVRVMRDEEVLEETVSDGTTPIVLPPGAVLELTAQTSDDDEQTVFVPVNNGASYEERSELITGSWFYTEGSLDFGDFDIFGDRLTVDWETEEGGRQWVHAVVRDGRAGLVWQSIPIDVE